MWPRPKALPRPRAAISDLELAPTDSDPGHGASNVNLGGESAIGAGLTGLSALELEDDEDQVLGEGSDVTLSSESSGINIISPSDSGLALDEVALDLAGSSPSVRRLTSAMSAMPPLPAAACRRLVSTWVGPPKPAKTSS